MILESYIQAWMKVGGSHSYADGYSIRNPSPRIVCRDGFSFSVQAGSNNYSTPRSDEAHAYTHFEVGYPSILEESLAPYAEDPDTTETVFGWVPLRVIVYLIEKHGGVSQDTQEV